ncbi:MAG: hypothetical protein B7Y93_06855 [Micrococcales bacterium 32-70-13]|nr:MAG: hypothetical protein B7Y93_06855 [Micrococcales bacterium 32-70-13]
MDTSHTNHLNLITGKTVDDNAADSGGCCGGGSCMCGTDGALAAMSTDAVAESSSTAVGTEFLVTGMTCGHCVSSVTEEVGAVAGVESVEVELKKGGASRVTVTSSGPLDADAVRAAVEEAGYQLA